MTRTCVAQVSSLACAVHISHQLMRHLHALMLCVWFSTTSHFSSSCCLSSLLSSCFSSWPLSSSSTLWRTNSLCTSANEDLGTLAEYDPLTQFAHQNSNTLHWHQKPTRRHTDQGKFHTWWMESSFVFVQHQPFQFYRLCWSNVEKNAKKNSGEERVTAKSKPMMNLVSRCSERTPDVLASIALQSPVKTRYESQLPLSPWTEQHHRTGILVEDAYSSSYSEWNECWQGLVFSRVEIWWIDGSKNRETCFIRTANGQIVEDDDMDSNTIEESDMSLKSRSFLLRVNDRVRKMLDQSSKRCNTRQRKTFCDMGNVHVCNIGISSIHGKELLAKCTFHQKYRKRSHNETDVRHLKSW